MTKTEMVALLANKQIGLSGKEIGKAVNTILDGIVDTLNEGQRVEIRGFGSFSLRYWGPRHARNPFTGNSWMTTPKTAIHFKAGKSLRESVNPKDDETS